MVNAVINISHSVTSVQSLVLTRRAHEKAHLPDCQHDGGQTGALDVAW